MRYCPGWVGGGSSGLVRRDLEAVPKFRMYFRTEKDPPTIRKIGILGSTGQSFKWTAPIMIIHNGMMTVRPQAIVHPIVPIRRRINLARKSTKFLDDLWVSRIRPKRES